MVIILKSGAFDDLLAFHGQVARLAGLAHDTDAGVCSRRSMRKGCTKVNVDGF